MHLATLFRAIVLLLAAVGVAHAQAPSGIGLATYDGADRTEKLVDGAKKEGDVLIYTSAPSDDFKALTEAFERKYGIKVKFWRSSADKVAQRGVSEARAQRFEADVFETDAPALAALARENVLTPARPPALDELMPEARLGHPAWIGVRVNVFAFAYNTKALPGGVPTWAETYDPKFKGRLIIPSLQNTEGLANLVIAAHLETGKPMDKAQYDIDAAFKKIKTLKPNLLTVYTQIPQAFNLLETGEGWAMASLFSSVVIPKEKESPVKMSTPKEGIFVGPAGVCLVKGGPNKEMALALIDMLLSADMQDKLQPETYAFPSNTAAKPPLGIGGDVKVHNLDWAFVAKERGEWVKRWDRDMAM